MCNCNIIQLITHWKNDPVSTNWNLQVLRELGPVDVCNSNYESKLHIGFWLIRLLNPLKLKPQVIIFICQEQNLKCDFCSIFYFIHKKGCTGRRSLTNGETDRDTGSFTKKNITSLRAPGGSLRGARHRYVLQDTMLNLLYFCKDILEYLYTRVVDRLFVLACILNGELQCTLFIYMN